MTQSVHACSWRTFCTLIDSMLRYWKIMDSKVQLTLFMLKKTFLYRQLCHFHGLKLSQGKTRALSRWDWKVNHLAMAYLLSNICTKHYSNRTTIVKVIVGGWVIYFLQHSVYEWSTVKFATSRSTHDLGSLLFQTSLRHTTFDLFIWSIRFCKANTFGDQRKSLSSQHV